MAREAVEIIRRAYDAWNRRDYEAAREVLDNVWTVRDGKVVEVAFHYERDAALRDAGSPEAPQRV